MQEPCPRCHSNDISHHSSGCICHCKPSCWSYPLCKRCGYSNYHASANSDGTAWMSKGTTFVAGISSNQPMLIFKMFVVVILLAALLGWAMLIFVWYPAHQHKQAQLLAKQLEEEQLKPYLEAAQLEVDQLIEQTTS